MQEIWSNILATLKAPLTEDLDIIHLFMLTGLILVFIAAWLMILSHIRTAASEVV